MAKHVLTKNDSDFDDWAVMFGGDLVAHDLIKEASVPEGSLTMYIRDPNTRELKMQGREYEVITRTGNVRIIQRNEAVRHREPPSAPQPVKEAPEEPQADPVPEAQEVVEEDDDTVQITTTRAVPKTRKR